MRSLAGDCIKLLLKEAILRAFGWMDGVWVGSDVSKCWKALWPSRNHLRGSMATGYCDPTARPRDCK